MNIKLTRNLGLLLLGIWLVLTGLAGLGLGFPGLSVVLALLALGAGIFILIGR